MTRRLVVNADDLGLTAGVNDGIFDAHDHGILTSASLMANAPATGDAIRRVHARKSLGIGAHLMLVDGAPVLPAERVPTLVDRYGRFPRSWKPFILACVSGQISMAEVEIELTAQIERLRAAGIVLTHLDAHKHVHAYPPIFAIVARLAGRFGVPVVRVPFERWRPMHARAEIGGAALRQTALNAALRPWARRDRQYADAYGLRAPEFIGRIHTGVLTADAFADLVAGLRPGVTELMVHPGYVDATLETTGTRLLASRERELDLLCRLDTRARLVAEGVDLVRHDLIHVSTRSLRHAS
jgi:chitin disaccharide deacetylase